MKDSNTPTCCRAHLCRGAGDYRVSVGRDLGLPGSAGGAAGIGCAAGVLLLCAICNEWGDDLGHAGADDVSGFVEYKRRMCNVKMVRFKIPYLNLLHLIQGDPSENQELANYLTSHIQIDRRYMQWRDPSGDLNSGLRALTSNNVKIACFFQNLADVYQDMFWREGVFAYN